MPPVQLHQGASANCKTEGSIGIPQATDTANKQQADTTNEISVTTNAGPTLVRIRAFAAVWMGTSIPVSKVMIKNVHIGIYYLK